MSQKIVSKIKKAGLVGRSGSCFPTGLKWELVKKTKAPKKYVIANGAEGEPGSFKDEYLFRNHSLELIAAIELAVKALKAERGYLYLKKKYYLLFSKNLKELIAKKPIVIVKKPGGYLAGEETAVCEAIEGRRPEPRLKPPFPSQAGLWQAPTLINNVETLYRVWQIDKGVYERKRFYSLSGKIKNKGVFEFPESYSVEQVLRESNNWPKFDFFVQSGGGASGEILLKDELNQPVKGIGALLVYSKKQTNPYRLMDGWLDFFMKQNCDKCTPCREGVYRLRQMVRSRKIDGKLFFDFMFALKNTSLCPLGRCLTVPLESALRKLF